MTITYKGTHVFIDCEPGIGKSSIMRSIFRRTLWQRFVDWLTGAPKKYGLKVVDAVEADVGDVALPFFGPTYPRSVTLLFDEFINAEVEKKDAT